MGRFGLKLAIKNGVLLRCLKNPVIFEGSINRMCVMKLSESERKTIKEKIESTLKELEIQITQLEQDTQPISPENSLGRVSRMDAINNKGVSEAALRGRKDKLNKLKIALTKVGDEKFGICDRCSNPIALPRLMFMPESDYCVHCAR